MLEVPRWRGWQNRARISSAFCGGEQETRELTISHRWANLRLMLAKRGTYVVQTRDSIDAMPEVRTVRCRAIVPRFCDQKRVGMGRVWLISNALWACYCTSLPRACVEAALHNYLMPCVHISAPTGRRWRDNRSFYACR